MNCAVKCLNGWDEVLTAARATVWKDDTGAEPSESFKKSMIRSEHSPLRELRFRVTITGVKSWIVGHLVRHHVGVEKYVSTSREDRTGRERGELVNVVLTINAQSLIDISKRRLCRQAHKETRAVWHKVRSEIRKIEPLLADAMVPSCVYRGFCPEKYCGLKFQKWREIYEES